MTQEMQLIDMVVIVSLLALMLYLVSKCNGKTWVFHESVEASLQTLRDEQAPRIKDRVRIIIICGNCGKPYHVPELTREIEIECSCGKKYAPWKEIEP